MLPSDSNIMKQSSAEQTVGSDQLTFNQKDLPSDLNVSQDEQPMITINANDTQKPKNHAGSVSFSTSIFSKAEVNKTYK